MVHQHRHVMDLDVMDHHLDLHLLVEHLNDHRRRRHRPVHQDRVVNTTSNIILKPPEQTYKHTDLFPSIAKQRFHLLYLCFSNNKPNKLSCSFFSSVFVYYMCVYLCESDKLETNLKDIK
jgi:hypothetical protein